MAIKDQGGGSILQTEGFTSWSLEYFYTIKLGMIPLLRIPLVMMITVFVLCFVLPLAIQRVFLPLYFKHIFSWINCARVMTRWKIQIGFIQFWTVFYEQFFMSSSFFVSGKKSQRKINREKEKSKVLDKGRKLHFTKHRNFWRRKFLRVQVFRVPCTKSAKYCCTYKFLLKLFRSVPRIWLYLI